MYLFVIILFISANSEDPDEMPHFVVFHLGLHCLPKYPLGVSHIQKVKPNVMEGQEKMKLKMAMRVVY